MFVIDNGSENRFEIERICKSFPDVEFIKLGFNLGVHALNIGISLALKSEAKLILLLDDDSYIKPGTIKKILESYERAHKASKQSYVLE